MFKRKKDSKDFILKKTVKYQKKRKDYTYIGHIFINSFPVSSMHGSKEKWTLKKKKGAYSTLNSNKN